MLKLPNVTLCCIDCVNQGKAIAAIKKSMEQCEFAAVKFITDIKIKIDGIEIANIPKIKSKKEYSEFCIKELNDYFDTEFILLIQHDGLVLNGDCWDNNFLKFDYIGAKWNYPKGERNVGNGGFSLRSKKLQSALQEDDFIQPTEQEDDCIVRLYGSYLERKYKIVFADEDTADKFSFELNEPCNKTFGFHGSFWEEFKPHIVFRREAALGDLIMLLPIVDYFHNKGYQVVLDTLPQFMAIFFQHPYKIKHISEMNPKIVPERVINFDMAYENKPQQSVFKSYCEMAEITDLEPQNSRLQVLAPKSEMLFQKYILIHCDEVGLNHRNATVSEWNFVVNYYKRLGYEVFQLGKRTNEIVATYINTPTLQMLMYIISGCDCLIGIDSSPAQIAVALGVPSAIFFGSVNPKLRYSDFSKIQIIHTDCPIDKNYFCYHNEPCSTTGVECEINKDLPPCTQYTQWQVLKAVNYLLNIKS